MVGAQSAWRTRQEVRTTLRKMEMEGKRREERRGHKGLYGVYIEHKKADTNLVSTPRHIVVCSPNGDV